MAFDLKREKERLRARDAAATKAREKVAAYEPDRLPDFLGAQLPMPCMIFVPFIREQSIGMLYAERGCGKTYIALAISLAIATGGKFLGWHSPSPRRVLYLDGEMAGVDMQDRLVSLVNGAGLSFADKRLANLEIITPDRMPLAMPIPNLATPEGQVWVESKLRRGDMLVLDNLSTLFSGGEENSGDDWQTAQDWFLRLRRKGITTLLIHHAGKGGNQRGTSRREDVLDYSISLTRPADYKIEQGLRAVVTFKKARGLHGDALRAFELRMETVIDRAEAGHAGEDWPISVGKKTVWHVGEVTDPDVAAFMELHNQGLSADEIAEELKVSRATVYRRREKAIAAGKITEDKPVVVPGSQPGTSRARRKVA